MPTITVVRGAAARERCRGRLGAIAAHPDRAVFENLLPLAIQRRRKWRNVEIDIEFKR